jgi:hypothetical protein
VYHKIVRLVDERVDSEVDGSAEEQIEKVVWMKRLLDR